MAGSITNLSAELVYQLQQVLHTPMADPPHASVGFAQLPVGRVTVKNIRTRENHANIRQRIEYAARNWKRVENHPNVHRLLGLVEETLSLVTLYVEMNLMEYLDVMPTLTNVDRFAMLKTVAHVLAYMHSQNPPILHINIKASNILVDNTGKILVTDIGVHDAIIPPGHLDSSVRWRAPEKLQTQGTFHTKKCDVWSMGMTILEVMSRRAPYAGMNDQAATVAIVQGQLPLLHPGCSEQLGEVLSLCWAHQPTQRSDMKCIAGYLHVISLSSNDLHYTSQDVVREIRSSKPQRHIYPLYPAQSRMSDFPARSEALWAELVNGGGSRLDKALCALPDPDAQCIVDFLDQLLVRSPVYKRERSLHLLAAVAKTTQALPKRLVLGGVSGSSGEPLSVGESDTTHCAKFDGQVVCVKAVRVYQRKATFRTFARELCLWAHLAHVNVLPVMGVYSSTDLIPKICMVSSWVDHGDLHHYLPQHPETSRLPLIVDIAHGLQYLHDMDLIHSNLKTTNVLVSNGGRAILADFGLAHLLKENALTNTDIHPRFRWTAPELLDDERTPTKASDIWSFGCICYEILTGKLPFHQMKTEIAVLRALLCGNAPATYDGELDQKTWEVLMKVWNQDPNKRPLVGQVIHLIAEMGYTDDRQPEETPHVTRVVSDVQVDYSAVDKILRRIKESM